MLGYAALRQTTSSTPPPATSFRLASSLVSHDHVMGPHSCLWMLSAVSTSIHFDGCHAWYP